ncbi:hypothetical protein [Sphingopyxis indica]|uniref:Uncharacterized protein n=1 Tax=Sphingopyxis indica TaxID=436663 RepID=A0A239LG08_9SPHN|nr:hypothetical protein [Sphingopyxis indica]SNT29587.1 hypothetical protein SAMN06295955_1246 [Sphingopyxis indica]
MSTATLLILSARLRSLSEAGRHEHPAPPVVHAGRSRVTRRVAQPLRFQQAGAGTDRSRSPLSGRSDHAPAGRERPAVVAGARELPSRVRDGLFAAIAAGLAAALLLVGAPARSQVAGETSDAREPDIVLPPVTVEAGPVTSAPATRIGGPPPGPCVTVDIAGHRAGHLECATDRLQAAAETAQAQTRSAIETPVIGAGSPDIQTGVANQTATRLRMGNTLGHSVHPQRPNRPVPPPRGGTP